MKDISRNLFFSFRGPNAGDDRARDRQLEDNLTKSLIALLEHADRDIYFRAFARLLGLTPAGEDVGFPLQRHPVGAMMVSRRLIVGITGGTPTVADGHDGTERGRPDAWILTDRRAILIES